MKKMMLSVLALALTLSFAMAANAKSVVGKCLPEVAAVAKAKAAAAAATAAYQQCKDKYKMTHAVRCRALKKAMVQAEADLAAARHNRRVCREGCGWLAKQVKDTADAEAACTAKYKLTHKVRCRNARKAAKLAAAQFAACKARK